MTVGLVRTVWAADAGAKAVKRVVCTVSVLFGVGKFWSGR